MNVDESTGQPSDLGTLIRGFRQADFPDHESMGQGIESALTDAWRRLCELAGLPSEDEARQVDIDMRRGRALLTHTGAHGRDLAIRVVMKVSLWRQFDMVHVRVSGGRRSSMAAPLTDKRSMTSRNGSFELVAGQVRQQVDEVGEWLDRNAGE